jgi:hypothetical protein
MDPLTNIELWFAKWGLYLIIGAVVVIGVVGWLGYNSWRNSQNVEHRETSIKTVGQANTNAAQHAVNTVESNGDKNADTDRKTAASVNNYYQSFPQAAKVQIDPKLFDNFRHNVCMYRAAADLPECRAMQQEHP